MILKQNRARFRGFGDEASDLQTSLDTAKSRLAADNDEVARLHAAINAKAASNVVSLPLGVPIGASSLVASKSSNVSPDLITTDASGNTKIFGMNWYIPVGGLVGLLVLLRR
jgi:uncharacterized small protein (DUF1192 family)